jgi:hypothetical protein
MTDSVVYSQSGTGESIFMTYYPAMTRSTITVRNVSMVINNTLGAFQAMVFLMLGAHTHSVISFIDVTATVFSLGGQGKGLLFASSVTSQTNMTLVVQRSSFNILKTTGIPSTCVEYLPSGAVTGFTLSIDGLDCKTPQTIVIAQPMYAVRIIPGGTFASSTITIRNLNSWSVGSTDCGAMYASSTSGGASWDTVKVAITGGSWWTSPNCDASYGVYVNNINWPVGGSLTVQDVRSSLNGFGTSVFAAHVSTTSTRKYNDHVQTYKNLSIAIASAANAYGMWYRSSGLDVAMMTTWQDVNVTITNSQRGACAYRTAATSSQWNRLTYTNVTCTILNPTTTDIIGFTWANSQMFGSVVTYEDCKVTVVAATSCALLKYSPGAVVMTQSQVTISGGTWLAQCADADIITTYSGMPMTNTNITVTKGANLTAIATTGSARGIYVAPSAITSNISVTGGAMLTIRAAGDATAVMLSSTFQTSSSLLLSGAVIDVEALGSSASGIDTSGATFASLARVAVTDTTFVVVGAGAATAVAGVRITGMVLVTGTGISIGSSSVAFRGPATMYPALVQLGSTIPAGYVRIAASTVALPGPMPIDELTNYRRASTLVALNNGPREWQGLLINDWVVECNVAPTANNTVYFYKGCTGTSFSMTAPLSNCVIIFHSCTYSASVSAAAALITWVNVTLLVESSSVNQLQLIGTFVNCTIRLYDMTFTGGSTAGLLFATTSVITDTTTLIEATNMTFNTAIQGSFVRSALTLSNVTSRFLSAYSLVYISGKVQQSIINLYNTTYDGSALTTILGGAFYVVNSAWFINSTAYIRDSRIFSDGGAGTVGLSFDSGALVQNASILVERTQFAILNPTGTLKFIVVRVTAVSSGLNVTLSQSNVNIVSSAAGGCALFQMSGAGTGARLAFVDSNATLSCVLVHMWYVSSTTLGDSTFITQNSDVALIAGSSDMRFIYFTVPSTGMSNAVVLVDRTTVLARSSTTPAAGTVMIDFTALKFSQLIVRNSNLTITGPPIGATGITAGTLTNSTIIVERSTILVESRTQNALAIFLSGASIGSALLVRDCTITALNDPLGIYGSTTAAIAVYAGTTGTWTSVVVYVTRSKLRSVCRGFAIATQMSNANAIDSVYAFESNEYAVTAVGLALLLSFDPTGTASGAMEITFNGTNTVALVGTGTYIRGIALQAGTIPAATSLRVSGFTGRLSGSGVVDFIYLSVNPANGVTVDVADLALTIATTGGTFAAELVYCSIATQSLFAMNIRNVTADISTTTGEARFFSMVGVGVGGTAAWSFNLTVADVNATVRSSGGLAAFAGVLAVWAPPATLLFRNVSATVIGQTGVSVIAVKSGSTNRWYSFTVVGQRIRGHRRNARQLGAAANADLDAAVRWHRRDVRQRGRGGDSGCHGAHAGLAAFEDDSFRVRDIPRCGVAIPAEGSHSPRDVHDVRQVHP